MPSTTPSLLALRGIPAFQDIPETELKRLAASMAIRSYQKRAVILRQGEPTRHVSFLLSGFVKVCRGGALSQRSDADRRTRPRQEIALAILGPNQMLGEIAALSDANRSASVVALSDCSLLQLEHEAFIDCTLRNPGVALFTMQYLAQRVVTANRQIELLRASIEARVIGLLRSMKEVGLPEELYPSNAELGRMVGASREMVSRIVQQNRTKPNESEASCPPLHAASPESFC